MHTLKSDHQGTKGTRSSFCKAMRFSVVNSKAANALSSGWIKLFVEDKCRRVLHESPGHTSIINHCN